MHRTPPRQGGALPTMPTPLVVVKGLCALPCSASERLGAVSPWFQPGETPRAPRHPLRHSRCARRGVSPRFQPWVPPHQTGPQPKSSLPARRVGGPWLLLAPCFSMGIRCPPIATCKNTPNQPGRSRAQNGPTNIGTSWRSSFGNESPTPFSPSLTGFAHTPIIGWLFGSLPRWRNRQTR
jgi:hypothetical protein